MKPAGIQRWAVGGALLFIILVGLLAYSNNYRNGWHFDDQSYIVQNPTIRTLDNFEGMWNRLTAPARVVVLYSFALNYHFGNTDVFGYHVVNNTIHILTALFVFGMVWLLLQTPRMRATALARGQLFIALFTALVFVSHPLQTQAVTYICQRFASLATLFYMAGIFFYLKGRLSARGKTLYFLSAAAATLLGMFSKQIVLTLPVAILLIEWLFFLRSDPQSGTGKGISWKVLIPILLFLLIIPALYSFRATNILSITHKSSGSYRGDLINSQSYALTQLRVIPTYLRLLVLPIGQNLLYDFPTSKSLWEGKTLAGLLMILIVLGVGFLIRHRQPLLAFGIFWFFLTLSVESSIIPIRHVIFEHRVYLPSIGFCLFLTAWLFTILQDRRRTTAILTVIVITLAVLTFERNKVWRDEFTLWEDVKVKSPHKMRPYLNTGIAHSEKGELDRAIADFKIALEKVPRSIMALNNLGVTYTKQKKFDEALDVYDQALKINDRWEEVWNNRGDVYRHRGQYAEALENYNRSLEINPQMHRTLSNRGVVLAHLGQTEKALQDFDRALTIAPGFIEAHQNRGNLFGQMRRYEEAAADFSVVISANPTVPEIFNNRGNAYRRLKQYDKAFHDYNAAIALDPEFAQAYNNRGVVYRQWEKYDLALRDYDTALRMNPDYVTAYNNRGNLLKVQGRYGDALEDFNTALKIEPENHVVYLNRAKTHLSQRDFEAALRDAEIAQHLGSGQAVPLVMNLRKVLDAKR
ncbi:MAG: tetratricopeptide repeat protein [Candidatus Omnitrophica bacterium]|nr:tetratricopeptide repeat protein [Candidatus Omnitrophota bacterium]